MTLLVANPLPITLAHYMTELSETLERAKISFRLMETRRVESGSDRLGRMHMLLNAIANSRTGKRQLKPVLITWPSLGLLDFRLWSSSRAKHVIVLHDPVPIRRQVGFGRVSRTLAARVSGRSPLVVVHSREAADAARTALPRSTVVVLPHPIRSEQDARPTAQPNRTVLVAGQYKPERDLELLARLGPRLREIDATGRIIGRGWPATDGWKVSSGFLTEDDLSREIRQAAVVLIPYRRYFQSGIALRALELGTLSLSPPNSFAESTFGKAGIVVGHEDETRWLEAISNVLERPGGARSVFDNYKHSVDTAWADLRRILGLSLNEDSQDSS